MQASENIFEMDTTLRVSTDTKDKLVDLGRKNETYDMIIRRLIDHWNKTHRKE